MGRIPIDSPGARGRGRRACRPSTARTVVRSQGCCRCRLAAGSSWGRSGVDLFRDEALGEGLAGVEEELADGGGIHGELVADLAGILVVVVAGVDDLADVFG